MFVLADIDDCENAPCLNGGTCLDGIDNNTCQCVDGWTGNDCSSSTWYLTKHYYVKQEYNIFNNTTHIGRKVTSNVTYAEIH